MQLKTCVSFIATVIVVGTLGCARKAEPTYDLWIKNGTVIDGTGQPAIRADVLITGDAITFVGELRGKEVQATRVIDATGKTVTPGFIDTHAHGDPLNESFNNFLTQGITTVVLGQDGNTADHDEAQRASRQMDAGCRPTRERSKYRHAVRARVAAASGGGGATTRRPRLSSSRR